MASWLWEKQFGRSNKKEGKFNAETETPIGRMAPFDARGASRKGSPH
jgi:hypothetical protein